MDADDPDKRLVSASSDVFATSRRTAVAVSDFKGLPADAEAKSGLVNKFPFDVQKKTYKIWDGTANLAADAQFVGEESISGLKTYKFVATVSDAAIEITAGFPGMYSSEKTVWVDPVTGSLIKQAQHQVRKMADSGQTVLDLDLAFTDAAVAKNVKDAKDNGKQLSLLTSTVPLVAGIFGLIFLGVGIFLARSALGAQAGAGAFSARGQGL